MRVRDKLRLRMRSLFQRKYVEQELSDEFAFHLEELTRENVAKGMDPSEAHRAALRAMGGVTQFEESCRDTRGLGWLEDFVQDVRYGLRVLRRTPAFTATAIACLALGIGANTAIFTVINAVLLRPLPYAEPGRLVAIWEDTPMFGIRDSPPATGNYVDWRAQARSFESMGALEHGFSALTGKGEPELVESSTVSASLFRVLGVAPLLGREFYEQEDRPGGEGVVILSYDLWQRRFAGSPGAIGSTLRINGRMRTVVGIMPRGFRTPDATGVLWTPFGNEFGPSEFSDRGHHDLMVLARLKPGVSRAQADAEMRVIARRLERLYPDTNRNVGAFVAPVREHLVANRTLYGILFAAVCFVLLIACANVASLLLSRAITRARELAIRVSLGAGRSRMARQIVAEHLLLAAAGGITATVLSLASLRFLGQIVPENITAVAPLSLDWRVFLFSISITAATCILFSLAPLIHAFRTDVNDVLKSGGRTGGSHNTAALRRVLVIGEVALAIVLLVGAGLLIHTFAHLRGVDPGFYTRNLLTLDAVPASFSGPAARLEYYREVLRRVGALPGVISAGFTLGIPIDFKGWLNGVTVDGAPQMPSVLYRAVTPDYLRTIGVPLVAGRELKESDTANAPKVALVNQAFAQMFWPGRDVVGRTFHDEGATSTTTVVGVVSNIRQSGLDVPPQPEYYVPYQQTNTNPPALVVRTQVPPATLVNAVRREIWAVNKDVPIVAVQTMEDILDHELSPRRMQTILLGFFAGSAILLAAIGIYGVLSYLVAQRRREIGLRLALGAQPSAILQDVMKQAAVLVGSGAAIGLVAALGLTRLMSSLLVGVTATDPVTFVAVPVLLAAVALTAGFLPARRAMRVDPALTLREE